MCLCAGYVQTGPPRGGVVKNPPAKAGGTGPIPGSGRSPGEGNGSPVQDSCLGNPRNRRAWQLHSVGSQRAGNNLATNQQQRDQTRSN